jgi:hypothetical protein
LILPYEFTELIISAVQDDLLQLRLVSKKLKKNVSVGIYMFSPSPETIEKKLKQLVEKNNSSNIFKRLRDGYP